MRFQKKEHYCGPASVANALEVYKQRVAQEKLATAGGTTDDGSDEEDIKRMILSEGFEPDEYATDLSVAAFGWVWNSLLLGRPVLLCVDRWEHWVCLYGIVGKQVIMMDPMRTEWNRARHGTYILPREDLLRRWEAAKRVRGKLDRFYGIGIGR